MTAALGTKRSCPDCGGKFYDFGASSIVCPKCKYAFSDSDLMASTSAVKEATIAIVSKSKSKKKAVPQTEDGEVEIKSLKAIETLEADEDYLDVDHFEEVEDHHEASEVDVNSDDADDEMFMDELAHGDVELLQEFDTIDGDDMRA